MFGLTVNLGDANYVSLRDFKTLLIGAGLDPAAVVAQATAARDEFSQNAAELNTKSTQIVTDATAEHKTAIMAADAALENQLTRADAMADQANAAETEAKRLTKVLGIVATAVKAPAAEEPATK